MVCFAFLNLATAVLFFAFRLSGCCGLPPDSLRLPVVPFSVIPVVIPLRASVFGLQAMGGVLGIRPYRPPYFLFIDSVSVTYPHMVA